ncbi:MAG: glycoside hydrolase family 32 protein [Sphingomonadales bacterium]|nr:glycoside hydrolase family 32 protein [Sphingomonadales bacterium]MDE2569128.1 glycoside hydrolase family 32 protein [Sphingomonadales bacterium]
MRPRYHFAARANWLSDPNGLVHHAGEWHMFYQYNPLGEDWGHMAWGHATSRDLASWTEHAPALVEDERFMIFSGSAVIDRSNSAGFGKEAMVAIYTGAVEAPNKHQAQCLGWSNDNGRTWTKFAGNPVLDRGMADFRDPNVTWHAASGRWIMVVVLSEEDRAVLYRSANLRDWEELSDIPAPPAPGHLWECPLLVELPVEGSGETLWMFKVDLISGAPGSGALYLLGSFDGERFVPDGEWRAVDAGSDFYAAIAWHEPRDNRDRPCWIGWMGNHAYQRALPLQGWRGAMSLPRRLSLRRGEMGLRLAQEVEPACRALFGPDRRIDATGAPVAIPAAARIVIDGSAGSWFLRLSDETGRTIGISRKGSRISIRRCDPVTPGLDIGREASITAGSAVELWLDAGSLELFADQGAIAMTLQHRIDPRSLRMEADCSVALAGLAG